jgi:hypothetical protein
VNGWLLPDVDGVEGVEGLLPPNHDERPDELDDPLELDPLERDDPEKLDERDGDE